PQAHISDLPLLAPHEQERLLIQCNATKTSGGCGEQLIPGGGQSLPLSDQPLQGRCVHQLFEQQVQRTPDAVALGFGEDEMLTYTELNRRANQLAHFLQDLAVGPEVLVGIFMQRSLEMVVGLLAVLKAGGAYVPLDPELPAQRLAFLLQDARVSVLLTQPELY